MDQSHVMMGMAVGQILVWLGVALLGWITGHMVATEKMIAPYIAAIPGAVTLGSALGAIVVTLTASQVVRRRRAAIERAAAAHPFHMAPSAPAEIADPLQRKPSSASRVTR